MVAALNLYLPFQSIPANMLSKNTNQLNAIDSVQLALADDHVLLRRSLATNAHVQGV
jgi:hypothetical protein